MGDINLEAYNFRQVLIALLTAAVVASAIELFSGCSSWCGGGESVGDKCRRRSGFSFATNWRDC